MPVPGLKACFNGAILRMLGSIYCESRQGKFFFQLVTQLFAEVGHLINTLHGLEPEPFIHLLGPEFLFPDIFHELFNILAAQRPYISLILLHPAAKIQKPRPPLSLRSKHLFMKPVYVIDSIRTPVGKYGGALSAVRPDDLLAYVIKSILQRNGTIDVNAIEEVIAGDANQAGEDNRNVARMAALLAGLPVTVAGNTVNRLCASGLQAIMDAARQVNNDDAALIIASGVESMTRAPFVMAKTTAAFQRSAEIYDTTLGWRFTNKKLAEQYYP
jgi:hypothetical protein